MTMLAPAPLRIGPTGLPERTLGWQVMGWCAEYLKHPDGPNAGQPWTFTDEQARFIAWWFAVDEDGRFLYRNGVLRRMKGWGKDPIASVLCAIEFVGPARFGGWVDGNPVGVPVAKSWVQIAAVAQMQTRNTTLWFPGLFNDRAIAEYGIDLGKEIIYGVGGSQIQAVTSAHRTLEGNQTTFAIANESEHWVPSAGGHDLIDVLKRNVAKMGGRILAICNAHSPGEDSVGEQDYEAYLKIESGAYRSSGLLYDSIEAPPETDLSADEDGPCGVITDDVLCEGTLRRDGERVRCDVCGRECVTLRDGLIAARGDSLWIDVDRLVEEIRDPRTPVEISRRFYLNQLHAGADAWVAPHLWNALARPDYRPEPGAMVCLGMDGSKSDDHTALVAIEVETQHLFTLGLWDPSEYGGEIPRGQVDAAVAQAFEAWDVVGFYCDVHPFETQIDTWAETYGDQLCATATARHPIGWDMGRSRQQQATRAVETFYDAIIEREITHEGDPAVSQYVFNARMRLNNYGTTFGKESRSSTRKVDWLAAAILARLCRQDYIALPEERKRKKAKGKPRFFNFGGEA